MAVLVGQTTPLVVFFLFFIPLSSIFLNIIFIVQETNALLVFNHFSVNSFKSVFISLCKRRRKTFFSLKTYFLELKLVSKVQ